MAFRNQISTHSSPSTMQSTTEPQVSSQSASMPSNKSDSTPISISINEPFGELDGAVNRLVNEKLNFNLKKTSLKMLYQNQWERLQSWGSFIDTNRMKTPNSTLQWSRRIVRNIDHFQSNYLCVFLILVIYCVLTSPLLLLAIAAVFGASYIIMLKNAESPLKLFGYQFSLPQQYLALLVISFPLFYLAGAGSAVFWVIGASFFVIGLHASIYAIEMSDTISDQPFEYSNQLSNLQTV